MISSTESDPTNANPVPITVTFSEVVIGFEASDLMVSGRSVSNFTDLGSGIYTFNLTPTAQGTLTVDISANVAEDDASNGNTVASQFSIFYDVNEMPSFTASNHSSLEDAGTQSIPNWASFDAGPDNEDATQL